MALRRADGHRFRSLRLQRRPAAMQEDLVSVAQRPARRLWNQGHTDGLGEGSALLRRPHRGNHRSARHRRRCCSPALRGTTCLGRSATDRHGQRHGPAPSLALMVAGSSRPGRAWPRIVPAGSRWHSWWSASGARSAAAGVADGWRLVWHVFAVTWSWPFSPSSFFATVPIASGTIVGRLRRSRCAQSCAPGTPVPRLIYFYGFASCSSSRSSRSY
jgi:hypothetical protein